MKPFFAAFVALCLSFSGVPVSAGAFQAPAAPLAAPSASLSLAVGPGLGAAGTDLANPLASAPLDPMAQVTGAATRQFPEDPGPVHRMWLIYESEEQRERLAPMIERIRERNPGLEVEYLTKAQALPAVEQDGTLSTEEARSLTRRLREGKIDLVLGSSPELYETLYSVRDSGFAHDVPFGFVGRRSVSIDIPRASLNPEALSDPRTLPHERYLVLSDADLALPDRQATGMNGSRATLQEILDDERHQEGPPKVKMPSLMKLGLALEMRLTGEADSRAMRELRRASQRLAAYLEREGVDVLVTDDALVARLAAEMKREGYHLSLPVVWHGAHIPQDASGLNLTLQSPLARETLARAVREAAALERLPENFGAEGGVTVKGYEETVRRAMAHPAVAGIPEGEIVFLLSSGNGDKKKGDMNPNGHFGMAVKNEKGEYRVWTVQYNDRRGASFTGGLGNDQLTLGEYLYRLHRLPGAASQASVLGETYVGRVWAFVLRGISADQIGAMIEKAVDLNEAHLAGKTRYEFFNKGGLVNCISMVTSILRAALFRISRSDIETPADKAFELMNSFFRDLLDNQFKDAQANLILFERPGHAASTYRIPNVPLSSPFLNFTKLWKEMSWWERIKTILRRPFQFLSVPRALAAFAAAATRRVIVDAGSRAPRIVENPDSPIAKLSRIPQEKERLQAESLRLREPRLALRKTIAESLGLKGYQLNPERLDAPVESEQLRRDIAEYKRLDALQKLNQIDQIILERQEQFLRIQVADPLGKFSTRLDKIRLAYRRVLAFRARLESEHRIPTQSEVAELDAVNEWVERELYHLRIRLLNHFGPPLPQSIKSVFEEAVTPDDLVDLGARPADETTAKKK